MKKIHQLSLPVIAKIAAGEVIERPAYAVKELIENAIDAHANYITIQIEEAGLKKIVVTDNGEGMEKEDIQECFKPHTTSKLSSEEDLLAISSLGFRGEALASIAAISTLTIKSKSLNAVAGTMIRIHNGKVLEVLPVGMPSGTSIRIDNLFSSVPGRKKFLKSIRTEFRHIVDVVMHYTLAYPTIRFFLTHDKRIILDAPPNQSIGERISLILGKQIFNQLIPFSYSEENITLSGFISHPQLTTQSTQKQYLFVNKRSVVDRHISSIIKEVYGNRLAATTYPIYIIFLSIPFEMVDVNVHPRKEYVLFVNSGVVSEHIVTAMNRALNTVHAIFSAQYKNSELVLGDSFRSGNTTSFAGRTLKEVTSPWQLKRELLDSTLIMQLHNVYLVVSTKYGMLLVDQHAAHERILYEQYQRAFIKQKQSKKIFTYLEPIQFEVSLSDAELVQEHRALFTTLGFNLEHFHDTTFLLRSVPYLFQDRDCTQLLLDVIDTIRQEKSTDDIDKQTKRMIAYLACRSAVKAGDKLTRDESKNLIEQLEKTENNATCPHGRPTRIEMRLEELHKIFKRK